MIPLVFALTDHLSHSNSIVSLSNVPLTIASGIEITISQNANKLFLKKIAPQSFQIGARFTTLTSFMEIIVHNQLNKARMVSMLQCVLITTECISLLNREMPKALEVRWNLPLEVIIAEDTDIVQDQEVKNQQALEATLDQAPWISRRDLVLEAMLDLIVTSSLALEATNLAPEVTMKLLEVTLDLALEVVLDQTAKVKKELPQEVMKLLLIVMRNQARPGEVTLDQAQ